MPVETVEGRMQHVAVSLDHCIIVFGGVKVNNDPLSLRTIWMFNLYTEQWRKHEIPNTKKAPPATRFAYAVTIGSDIYMFGGYSQFRRRWYFTNALWKLSRTRRGTFAWKTIKYHSKEQCPSPRAEASGWEYVGHLWIYGGLGDSSNEYIYDNGDFDTWGETNQLLHFDLLRKEWTKAESFGTTPAPRRRPSTAIIGGKVWLFGGYNRNHHLDDLYALDMHSLVWTEIATGQPYPVAHRFCTLTAITNRQLVLHGCFCNGAEQKLNNLTWILDLPSLSWTKHSCKIASKEKHSRIFQTCTLALHGEVLVVGGTSYYDFPDWRQHTHENIHMMLEPKSLKQQAIKTIYNNKDNVPLESLPKKLTSLLEFL